MLWEFGATCLSAWEKGVGSRHEGTQSCVLLSLNNTYLVCVSILPSCVTHHSPHYCRLVTGAVLAANPLWDARVGSTTAPGSQMALSYSMNPLVSCKQSVKRNMVAQICDSVPCLNAVWREK